eukprot:2009031-Amphidinium_carterae.1
MSAASSSNWLGGHAACWQRLARDVANSSCDSKPSPLGSNLSNPSPPETIEGGFPLRRATTNHRQRQLPGRHAEHAQSHLPEDQHLQASVHLPILWTRLPAKLTLPNLVIQRPMGGTLQRHHPTYTHAHTWSQAPMGTSTSMQRGCLT